MIPSSLISLLFSPLLHPSLFPEITNSRDLSFTESSGYSCPGGTNRGRVVEGGD